MEDLIVVRKSDLFCLLGEYALPPWPDGKGGWFGPNIDCAELASELIDRMGELEMWAAFDQDFPLNWEVCG